MKKPGPAAGVPAGQRTARERYYRAMAEKQEFANAVRRGELIETAEIRAGWSAVVLAIRESFVTLARGLGQRGLVKPEDEPAAQAYVDEILDRLSKGRGGPKSRYTPVVKP